MLSQMAVFRLVLELQRSVVCVEHSCFTWSLPNT